MKETVLHKKHIALDAKMAEFAGYDMPIVYSSITEEHQKVRESCGLFDVSHMGEITIKGDEATQCVDYLFTNDVLSMSGKEVLYGMMCYEDGGVVDDLLVYKFHNKHYLLVVNASNVDKDFEWITKQNTFHCTVTNESNYYSQLALQGPKAEGILQKLTQFDLNLIEFFHFENVLLDNRIYMVSRTGYTGEDGFEIYGTHQEIVALWDKLLDIGNDDILPVGLGARDTLRFEVNLPLYGNELSQSITPLEAGYHFAVKLDAEPFIGRDVLKKQKETKTKRRIVGLELLDKGIIRHGYDVYHEDTLVGFVTTGYKSPSTGKTVALAMVDRPYDKLGTKLEVNVRNKRKKVVVIKKKFYNKNYKK
ncbi:MAG: glycine cleavage system aminomethyltransferase GcvT [Candidatus Izemoplasma sp.]|nr:glycine cleavage system aminomethyltransferase GcvT [Candidatus Izemoplasma sp.]